MKVVFDGESEIVSRTHPIGTLWLCENVIKQMFVITRVERERQIGGTTTVLSQMEKKLFVCAACDDIKVNPHEIPFI